MWLENVAYQEILQDLSGFSLEKRRLNGDFTGLCSYLIEKMVPDVPEKAQRCGKVQWTQAARLESSDQI